MEKGENTTAYIKKGNKTRDCARRKKSLCFFLFEGEKYIKRKRKNFIWKNKNRFFLMDKKFLVGLFLRIFFLVSHHHSSYQVRQI
jgi:hypothetical protein